MTSRKALALSMVAMAFNAEAQRVKWSDVEDYNSWEHDPSIGTCTIDVEAEKTTERARLDWTTDKPVHSSARQRARYARQIAKGQIK